MSMASLLTLIGVWIVLLVTPGPDVVQVIRTAPRSRRAGLLCAAGIATGTGVWLAASLAGLSALIAARPELLSGLQVIGGGVLIYMGLSSLRGGLRTSQPEASQPERVQGVLTAGKAYRLGLMTNLSNPKALVFFGAVFAQFLSPGMSALWTVAVGIILLAISFVWFGGFSLVVRTAARWLARHGNWLDIVAGIIFTIFGLVMLVEGVMGLVN